MGEHLVLSVDGLITPDSSQSLHGAKAPMSSGESSCSTAADPCISTINIKEEEENDEEEPLLQTVECRICQEEDSIKNLESPCACSGSLKVSSPEVCCVNDVHLVTFFFGCKRKFFSKLYMDVLRV